MKNMNKGVMIGTLAAALAAVTFAGCGSTIEQATNTAPARVEAAVATTAEAAKPEVKTEDAAKAKDTKKTKNTKKSKKSKKNTKAAEPAAAAKPAEPQTIVVQTPAPVVQTVAPAAAQPAQAPAVEAPKTEKSVAEDVCSVWADGTYEGGTYYEETQGSGKMEVTCNGDNTYSVEISWPSSANETNYWDLTGSIDRNGNLNYTNCRKTAKNVSSGESYTVYSAGAGSLKFGNCGVVAWTDNMGDILPGTRFVSYQPKAATAETTYNTKADEVGTAGSNYYANESSFITGSLYDANGSKATLEIYKSNVLEGTYDVIVTCPVSLGEHKTYGFNCKFQADGALIGENGAVSRQVFDVNNNMIENSITETGHYCQLRQNGNLIEWSDSDGSYYAFTR